jgi:hypothetical protein
VKIRAAIWRDLQTSGFSAQPQNPNPCSFEPLEEKNAKKANILKKFSFFLAKKPFFSSGGLLFFFFHAKIASAVRNGPDLPPA